MTGVPIEFEKLLNRITLLKNGIQNQNEIDFNYGLLVDEFKFVASNTKYKNIADLFITKFKILLIVILEDKSCILKNLKQYSSFKDVGEGFQEMTDEFGVPYEVPIISLEETVTLISDEYRINHFKKFILPELQAYKMLIDEYGHGEVTLKKFIDEKIALMTASIEVGDSDRFIKSGTSTDNFVALLTDPFLTNTEIKKMKIEIAVSVNDAAYIFNELYDKGITDFSLESVGEYGIFLNGTTILTAEYLRSSLAKFKSDFRSRKLRVLDKEKDISKCVELILQNSK